MVGSGKHESRNKDLREHSQTLPSLSKTHNDIVNRHSRGERQRREIEAKRRGFNASDLNKETDRKNIMDALD